MRIIKLLCLLILVSSCSDQKELEKVDTEKEVYKYESSQFIMINDSVVNAGKINYAVTLAIDKNILTWTKYNLKENHPLTLNGLVINDSLSIKGSLNECSKYDEILNWEELSSFSKKNTLARYKDFWGDSEKKDSIALTILLLQDLGSFNLGLGYLKDPTDLCWSVDSIECKGKLCNIIIVSMAGVEYTEQHHLDLWSHFNRSKIDEASIATVTSKILVDTERKVVLSTESVLSITDLESNIYSKVQKMSLN